MTPEDALPGRMRLFGDPTQERGPTHTQLPVEKLLRSFHICHLDATIVAAEVSDALGVHLPGQPLAAVEADVHGEG